MYARVPFESLPIHGLMQIVYALERIIDHFSCIAGMKNSFFSLMQGINIPQEGLRRLPLGWGYLIPCIALAMGYGLKKLNRIFLGLQHF